MPWRPDSGQCSQRHGPRLIFYLVGAARSMTNKRVACFLVCLYIPCRWTLLSMLSLVVLSLRFAGAEDLSSNVGGAATTDRIGQASSREDAQPPTSHEVHPITFQSYLSTPAQVPHAPCDAAGLRISPHASAVRGACVTRRSSRGLSYIWGVDPHVGCSSARANRGWLHWLGARRPMPDHCGQRPRGFGASGRLPNHRSQL